MTDERRRDQSKFDRAAAGPSGIPSPSSPPAPNQAQQPPAAAPTSTQPAPLLAAPVQRVPAIPPPPAPAAPTSQAVPAAPVPAGPVAGSRRPMASQPAQAQLENDEGYEDDEELEDEEQLTFVERLRRLPPAPVILTLGSLGSLVFLLLAVTSHTTPVAILLSAAVVTGLIFGVDAVIASATTWRASQSGEVGHAFLAAIVGGIASLVSLGAFAGTLVLILVLLST